ncbi:MAG: helix-turn-helix domain-containing protein [Pyrinomonadaceae bacterium]
MDLRVLKVIDRIEAMPEQGLPFEALAKSMNISPSRLRHLFTNEVGASPRQYLRTIRMEHAKHLIENTYLNVKEVMTKVGLGDESHFVRDFARVYGRTPGRHREHHRLSNRLATYDERPKPEQSAQQTP